MVAQLRYQLSSQPSLSNEAVRGWLVGLRWPAGECDALLLAVTEAIDNAFEHAYRGAIGEVTVEGRQELTRSGLRRVVLTVTDRGRWRFTHQCHPPRGHGLRLMRELTEAINIAADAGGTRVQLISRSVARFVPDGHRSMTD